jgi:dTDP-4-dehydrorhamnose 3,5-epimerase
VVEPHFWQLMEIKKYDINGPLLIKPDVFEDARGYFFESFNQKRFGELTGLNPDFVQDNESKSNKGVLRGLHFQAPPYGQAKLVRVVKGSVRDVVVDIRKDSKTFGQYCSVVLSAENKNQFYVPAGFAHGFAVLEDDTVFAYKCSGYYNRESEMALMWNDPEIGIEWGISEPLLSEKDRNNSVTIRELDSPF